LFQVEPGQHRDVSDGYLECSERTQWGSLVECARAGYIREVRQLGCLVHDVSGGGEGAVVHEGGNFEELQRNLHAAVDGVGVTEDRAREDDEAPAVVGCVVLQVGLQAEPEVNSLVEFGRLRGCVRVVERVRIGPGGFLPRVAPDC
jgi:hypothetical protein